MEEKENPLQNNFDLFLEENWLNLFGGDDSSKIFKSNFDDVSMKLLESGILKYYNGSLS